MREFGHAGGAYAPSKELPRRTNLPVVVSFLGETLQMLAKPGRLTNRQWRRTAPCLRAYYGIKSGNPSMLRRLGAWRWVPKSDRLSGEWRPGPLPLAD